MKLDFDDEETYHLLLQACVPYQVDPSMSLDAEVFFRELLTQYAGFLDQESLSAWLKQKIEQSFISLNERPQWVQNSEWPFVNDRPAIFVGQIDISLKNNEAASQIFHDDTCLYVFVAKKEAPIVVMQQY